MNNSINIADAHVKLITANTPEELLIEFERWRDMQKNEAGMDLVEVVPLSGDRPAIMIIFTFKY